MTSTFSWEPRGQAAGNEPIRIIPFQTFLSSKMAGLLLLGVSLLAVAHTTMAGEVRLAVAANFTAPLKQLLIPAFERQTQHTVLASFGSSGSLYAQIVQGAPFDVLLSADAERPRLLEAGRHSVPASRFTYALGRLVLWSPNTSLVDAQGDALRKGNFQHVAIPNPKLAPYGAAAQQTLRKLGLWETLEGKLVYGQDINQTYDMIRSENAALGFVSLAQVLAGGSRGSTWQVPATLHDPIEQQAVLLKRAASNTAATAFLRFLAGEEGRALVVRAGYDVP
jgi:molybdate transport system substrate-binding protein